MTEQGNIPLRIRKVIVKGNKRTKARIFEHEMQEAYNAETLEEVQNGILDAARGLEKLGAFSSVDMQLDAVKDQSNETDVTITVKEKNGWKLNVGGNTDGYEGTAESSFSLINPTGLGESVMGSMSKGHIGSASTRMQYCQPNFYGLPLLFKINALNETMAYERVSSYSEKIRGGDISFASGEHEVALNLGWRDIVPRRNPRTPTAFAASTSIISEATPSMKTSLKYTFHSDTRDSSYVPTSGGLLNYSTEVAGLFGDVSFVKAESNVQKHFPFGPIIEGNGSLLTLSICSKLGCAKSYGADSEKAVRISDRFFLGGPTTLRGFQHKGVGPRASADEGGNLSGDALGGEALYSASASIGFPFPIPLMMMSGFRGQFFANMGNLCSWNRIFDSGNCLKNIAEDTRLSCGVGIVLGTALGRLEANYSWVLRSNSGDLVKPGQLGLSISFS